MLILKAALPSNCLSCVGKCLCVYNRSRVVLRLSVICKLVLSVLVLEAVLRLSYPSCVN